MSLSDFNSFFEIFAALNLAYAGSEKFRKLYNEKIFHTNDVYSEKNKKTINRLKNIFDAYSIGEYSDKVRKKLDQTGAIIRLINLKLLKKGKKYSDFSNLFKTVFLLMGIFCLSYLISAGFYGSLTNYGDISKSILILSIPVYLMYTIIITLLTFTKLCQKSVKAIVPISLFFFVAIVSIYFSDKLIVFCSTISIEKIVIYSIFLSLSPYIFHIIRDTLYKQFYRLNIEFNFLLASALLYRVQDAIETSMEINKLGEISLSKKIVYQLICHFHEKKIESELRKKDRKAR